MKFRYPAALLILAAAAIGWPSLQKAIVPNNALTVWFLEDDSLLTGYRRFQHLFGNDETIAILVTDTAGILRAETLTRIRRLSDDLRRHAGVARVWSLTGAVDLASGKPLVPHDLSRIPLDSLAATLRQNPLVMRRFVDSNLTSAMILVQMAVMDDIDQKRDAIVRAVRATALSAFDEGQVHLGGLGVVYTALNEITQRDFGLFVGLSYTVMFAIMFLLFRRIVLVLLSLSAVAVATMLTLELYGALGYQVNMLTMTIPTIIVILAILDMLHIIHETVALRATAPDGLDATQRALKTVFLPCLFTTLTTIAGLISFVFSPMAVLREFGWFASLGILLAFVCSFAFAAAVLPLVHAAPMRLASSGATRLGRWYDALLRRRFFVLAIFAGFTVLCGWGISRIVVDTYTIGYLPADHPVVSDHEYIRSHWGDYLTLEYLVTPHAGRSAEDAIDAMNRFSDAVLRERWVEQTFGVHTIVQYLETAGMEDHATLADHEDDLRAYVDDAGNHFRLTLIGPMMSARHLDALLTRLDSVAHGLQAGASFQAAGYPPLYARIIDYVTRSQIQSFYTALLLIFGMMWILLRSARDAVVSLVPNLFPVCVLLGVMGLAGLTLDIATATTAAIVLGFSIDDTIHFMVAYRRSRRAGIPQPIRSTVGHEGFAVVLNGAILFAGYSVLLLADVKTVYYFGLLTMIAVLAGVAAELTLLPLLLQLWDSKVDSKKNSL